MSAEDYLNENVMPDDWSRLEESLNDSLWTNNVIKYMEGYAIGKWRPVEEAPFNKPLLVLYMPDAPIMEVTTWGIDRRIDLKGTSMPHHLRNKLIDNKGFIKNVVFWMELPQKPKDGKVFYDLLPPDPVK